MSATRVLTGPYAGFTKAEMLAVWQDYKAALKSRAGSNLTSASINGQSFSFGAAGNMSLVEAGRHIRAALSQVDPGWTPPSQAIAVRFRDPSC